MAFNEAASAPGQLASASAAQNAAAEHPYAYAEDSLIRFMESLISAFILPRLIEPFITKDLFFIYVLSATDEQCDTYVGYTGCLPQRDAHGMGHGYYSKAAACVVVGCSGMSDKTMFHLREFVYSRHPDPRRVWKGGSEQHLLTPLPQAPRAPRANSKKLDVAVFYHVFCTIALPVFVKTAI